METFTPKQILEELIPKHFGDTFSTTDKEVKFLFSEQIMDGSLGYVIIDKEPIASFRVRFSNTMLLKADSTGIVLQCEITNFLFIKPGVEQTVEDVSDEKAVVNPPPESKPTQPIIPKARGTGRGRGGKKT